MVGPGAGWGGPSTPTGDVDKPQDEDLTVPLDELPAEVLVEEESFVPDDVVEPLLLGSLLVEPVPLESLFAAAESPDVEPAPSEELAEAVDTADEVFFLSASRLSLR